MDYNALQKIAKGVVSTSAACDGQLVTGKVTSANPLKIQLGKEAGGIVLDGDDIILTQAVVSKKLYIKKHNHTESEALIDYTATGNLGAPILFAPLGVDLYIPNPNYDPSQPRTDTDEAKGTGTNPMYILNPAVPTPTTLPLKHLHGINTSTLDAWVTEYGSKLPVDPSDYDQSGEQVVITINRSLEVGDHVIMSMVSHGQQFVVLSRYFEVDNPGKDDEGE